MNWSALGENPVPGESDAVLRVASVLGRVCDEAEAIHRRLRVLDGGSGPQIWRGDAADAFRELLAKVGPDLAKLSSSHLSAQQALRDYAVSLDQAQGQARSAEVDAESAVADRAAAENRRQQASADAASQDAVARAAGLRILQAQGQAAAAPFDPTYQASMQQYQQQVASQQAVARGRAAVAHQQEAVAHAAATAADARLAAAKKLAHQAAMMRDGAAQTTVRRLDAAGARGLSHENVLKRAWNGFTSAVRDVTASPEWATWMQRLSDIGDVLSLMATVAAFIPGLNVAAGPLLLLAAGFKGAAFLGTLMAALSGHASAGQVVGRGFDFALSFIPLVKGGSLAGQVKRSFNYDDAREATGYLRTLKVDPQLGGGWLKAAELGGKRISGLTPERFFQAKTGVGILETVVKPFILGPTLVKDFGGRGTDDYRDNHAGGLIPSVAEKLTDGSVRLVTP